MYSFDAPRSRCSRGTAGVFREGDPIASHVTPARFFKTPTWASASVRGVAQARFWFHFARAALDQGKDSESSMKPAPVMITLIVPKRPPDPIQQFVRMVSALSTVL